MYKTGDMVVYGGVGVCCVESVGKPEHPLPGADPERLNYTLRPLNESGVVYTPVDARVFMRPVMSRQQAAELIDSLPQVTALDGIAGDYRQLAGQYRAALQTHQIGTLLRLLKTLHQRQEHCLAQGKLPGKVDRQFQQTAEKFLYEELSCALDIPTDAVHDYIQQRLDKAAAEAAAGANA